MDKPEDVVTCRFYHGLRLAIIYLLTSHNFETVDEVVQYALKAEEIANYLTLASFKGTGQLSFSSQTSVQIKSSQDTVSRF